MPFQHASEHAQSIQALLQIQVGDAGGIQSLLHRGETGQLGLQQPEDGRVLGEKRIKDGRGRTCRLIGQIAARSEDLRHPARSRIELHERLGAKLLLQIHSRLPLRLHDGAGRDPGVVVWQRFSLREQLRLPKR